VSGKKEKLSATWDYSKTPYRYALGCRAAQTSTGTEAVLPSQAGMGLRPVFTSREHTRLIDFYLLGLHDAMGRQYCLYRFKEP